MILSINMSFALVDNDYTDKINIILSNFNLKDLKYEKLYISGSLVLNLINNNEIENTSDLDLYLDIYKMNRFDLENIISKFIYAGYYLKQSNFSLLTNDDLKIVNKYTLKSGIINKIVKKILKSSKMNNDYEITYFSLRNHISTIVRLYNPIIDKEIDIIILKPKKDNTIQKILLDTFDYDIVKNYIEYDLENDKYNTYSYNYQGIKDNVATMTLDHFISRILDNIHEFNNFITRYVKYSYLRKWKVYIDKLEINKDYFLNILNIYINNVTFNYIEKCICYNNNYYKVSKVKINTNTNDLSEIYKIYLRANERKQKIYTFNLRLYILENECYSFEDNKVKDKVLAYYSNIITPLLINKNSELYSSFIESIVNQKILDKLKSLHVKDECIVCYDRKLLYNIYCGNNHKLCGRCLNKLRNDSCPMCRNTTFSK